MRGPHCHCTAPLVSRESDLDAVVLTAAIHAGDAQRDSLHGHHGRNRPNSLPESRSHARSHRVDGRDRRRVCCATTLRWFPGYPVTNNVPELVDLRTPKSLNPKAKTPFAPWKPRSAPRTFVLRRESSGRFLSLPRWHGHAKRPRVHLRLQRSSHPPWGGDHGSSRTGTTGMTVVDPADLSLGIVTD